MGLSSVFGLMAADVLDRVLYWAGLFWGVAAIGLGLLLLPWLARAIRSWFF